MADSTRTPEYRFALYDLLTRSQLSEHMPFAVDNYERSLLEAGTVSATLDVSDAKIQKVNPWGLTQPRRTTLVVCRDDVVIAEYLIWQRPPYKPTEKRLQINAAELPSYFDHRMLRPTGGPGSKKTLSFAQVDQFAIFRALVNDAQAVTFQGLEVGNVSIETDSTLSGVLRDRKDVKDDRGAYHGYEFTSYGELLHNLASLDNGFEWRIDSFFDEDRRLRRALRLGYPYLGHGPNDDATVLEYPGAVVDYEWPEDGTDRVNYVAAVGAGEEEKMKWGEAFSSAELLSGYPLLERTTPYKSANVQSTLDAHATSDVKALSGDLVVPTVTVRGRPNIAPGDHVKVRISDEARFAGSSRRPFETFMRAIQITTKPGPPEITTIAVEAPRIPGEDSS
jgi:hypothetical protein